MPEKEPEYDCFEVTVERVLANGKAVVELSEIIKVPKLENPNEPGPSES